jgi:hypothetical protein
MDSVDAEFRDAERIELVKRLLRAVRKGEAEAGHGPGSTPPLNELIWSCLWLADVKSLADVVQKFENDPLSYQALLTGYFQAAELKTLCRYPLSSYLDRSR